MTSRVRAVAVALVLLGGVSVAAEAQVGPMEFGPRVTYNFDMEEFAIGVHLVKPLTSAISFYPSFDYYMVGDGLTLWGFNADLTYQVPSESLQWLYLGAGLGIFRSSGGGFSNTDTGLNLIGGFQPAGGARIKPFAEARFQIGGGESFSVVGGLKIPLGN